MARRSKQSGRRWLLTIVLVALIAVVVWRVWPPTETATDGPAAGENDGPAPSAVENIPDEKPPAKPDATATQDASPPAASAANAAAAYKRGMELLKANSLVEARSQLSKAYYSGKLPAARQAELRSTLTELADITLIGPRTTVHPDDPYTFYYKFEPGETIGKVERKLKLHVPWQILLKVNGLRRAEDIQAGVAYKMIRGPFHAVIAKGKFTMDVYLQRDGLERVFVKRLHVGTGANGSTPAGKWRVRLGGKEYHPTWYPPPNSEFRGPVPYGSENYAFGAKGLWISLEGLDEHTRELTDYGIHSTSDPASIGVAKSLGCIRLADDDIELLYSLLYEHWSTVEVRP